jgi:hypothetical protein
MRNHYAFSFAVAVVSVLFMRKTMRENPSLKKTDEGCMRGEKFVLVMNKGFYSGKTSKHC